MNKKKELVEGLIKLYTTAIGAVKVTSNPIDACYIYGVQQGVCTAMARAFGRSSSEMLENYNLMADEFAKYSDGGGSPWWGPTPQDISLNALPFIQLEREEIITALEYRLSILNEIYEQQP